VISQDDHHCFDFQEQDSHKAGTGAMPGYVPDVAALAAL
jgi:hypothetical protein